MANNAIKSILNGSIFEQRKTRPYQNCCHNINQQVTFKYNFQEDKVIRYFQPTSHGQRGDCKILIKLKEKTTGHFNLRQHMFHNTHINLAYMKKA